jgi:RHS repeat-associated protein
VAKIKLTNFGTSVVSDGNIALEPGEMREFGSACELIRFVNAAGESILESAPGESVDRLNALGEAEGCPEKATGRVIATGDSPAQALGSQQTDSPEAQGAPSPAGTATVEVEDAPHGEAPDGRQPTQAMHDRRNPQSEGEIVDGELARGATPEAAAVAAERARRGDPPEGQGRSTHQGERTATPSEGGDPVDLFTGVLALHEVDLDVPAPFIPIQLRRHYLSGLPTFGPWGFNWDHNWNVFLRELSSGNVARWNGGTLHEDEFRWTGSAFEPPRGVFETLEREPGPGTGFTLRAPHGLFMRFERPIGWTDGERIPLASVHDRAGNTVRLTYDTSNRLAAVRDDDGRGLSFDYGDCDRLEAVEDHSGRRVTYGHDEAAEHLVEVRLPATSDHPDGLSTHYEYAFFADHVALRHNLLRVIDHDGNVTLENRYGEDPADIAFNRVVEQIQGGYRYELAYRQLQFVPSDPAFVNIEAMQTAVRHPEGALWTYSFNYRGDLLDERFRLAADGSFRVVITRRSFDAEGNLTEFVSPDGSGSVFTYDHQNPNPRMRRNLLRAELRASPVAPVPSRLVFRCDYDPTFQFPRRIVAENGAVTRLVFDHEGVPPGGPGNLLRIEWPDVTLPDGSVQTSVTRFESNARGQTSAIISPEGVRDEWDYVPTGTSLAGFASEHRADVAGVREVTRYGYDTHGYLSERFEPGGARVGLAHDALGALAEVTLPEVDGETHRIRYHYNTQRRLASVERPRGAYADDVISGDLIVDTYHTNPLGHLCELVVGANTAEPRRYRIATDYAGRPVRVEDPAGTLTERCFDERGLVIREVRGAGSPVAFTTELIYDTNGRLFRSRQPDSRTTELGYDPWGRVSTVSLPNGSVVRATWSEFNLLATHEIEGDPADGTAPRLLRRLANDYDARGRLVRTTLFAFGDDPGAATPLALVKWYDRDGRCVRKIAPRNAEWLLSYDGRNRMTAATDPAGNRREWSFGPDGLPQRMSWIENGPGGATTRFVELGHDARHRMRALRSSLGNELGFSYDARDLPTERVNELSIPTRFRFGLLGELLELETEPAGQALRYRHGFDRLGRPTQFIDPVGERTTVERDALGRIERVLLADGGVVQRGYSAAGDLERLETPDGSVIRYTFDAGGQPETMTVTPSPARVPVPLHRYQHDGLGRVTRIEAGSESVRRKFDSLDRLLEDEAGGRLFSRRFDDAAGRFTLRFPSGREEQSTLDALGRVQRVELVDPGVSAVADAAGSVPLLLELGFRGGERVAQLRYGNGAASELMHDGDGRLLSVTHQSPAAGALESVRYRLDRSGSRRIAQVTGGAPENHWFEYDARRRLITWRRGFPLAALGDAATQAEQDASIAGAAAASASASLEEHYELDGADTRLSVRTTAAGVSVDVAYGQAPGHRLVSVGPVTFGYDGDGRRTSGGGFGYVYDALGRLVEVAPAAGGAVIARFGYDPAGRTTLISQGASLRRRLHFETLPLVDEDAAGEVLAERTQAPLLDLPSVETTVAGRHYLHVDGHENLTLVTDASGAAIERYRYDAFGAPRVFDGAGQSERSGSTLGPGPIFGAMPFLPALGLYHTPARLYDPATGVFLARDPLLHFESPSPYVFGAHDPQNRIDPDGQIAPLIVAGLVVGAIGSVVGMASVVIHGGDYDAWDVLAAGAIGFGAGFIGGVTFGAASGAVGGAMLTAVEGTALASSAWVGTGISITSGVVGGAASGFLSGGVSGAASGLYQGYRGGGDGWELAWQGAQQEAVSGLAAGAVGGGLFQGLARVGTLPRGSWAALRDASRATSRSAVLPGIIGRGLASPYGPAGAAGIGFASGYTGGVVRRLWQGQDMESAASGAVDDGWSGAATSLFSTAVHPTSTEYWRTRLSLDAARQVQRLRPGEVHHQRNVAQYPEFANPAPNGNNRLNPVTRLNNAVTKGNLQGRFSEYNADPDPAARHQQLHELWQFGQNGNWTNFSTHGPWTPAWNVANTPVDPRATNHKEKP